MKEKSPLIALPWCCVVPIILSFLGLGSATMGRFLMKFLPLFIITSVTLIGYANYNVHFGSHKVAKSAKVWVGITTVISILLWIWSFNRMGLI